MKPFEHVSLQCIYCDDIRDEANGKTTIVGWYGNEVISLPPEKPLVLSNLCVIGMVTMPLFSKFTSFKVELMQDENVVQSIIVPSEPVEAMQESDNGSSFPQIGKQVRIAIKMLNMQISNPCILRLRIVLDGNEVSGNGLCFTR